MNHGTTFHTLDYIYSPWSTPKVKLFLFKTGNIFQKMRRFERRRKMLILLNQSSEDRLRFAGNERMQVEFPANLDEIL